MPDTSSEGRATRWIGRIVDDRYRVLELISEGGMGAVFVAEHLKLRKQVALKTIRPDLVSRTSGPDPGQAEARFAREALATAQLDHPHIASAIDYGHLPEGGAYLVTQLVRGTSLTRRLQKGPLSWLETCRLGSQVADALTAAHALGIVHRDLKPDNILLETRDDGLLHARVVDFGVARITDDGDAGRAGKPITRIGAVIGTPGYMAPEQAVGEAVDHRADLYALGVILWECCTGIPLWQEASLTELYARQLSQPAPSLRTALPGDIPPALARLVDQLLARNPDERPASAAVVRDELRRLALTGEVHLAMQPPGPGPGPAASLSGPIPVPSDISLPARGPTGTLADTAPAASLSAPSPVPSDTSPPARGPTGTLAASSLSAAAIPVLSDISTSSRGPTGTLADTAPASLSTASPILSDIHTSRGPTGTLADTAPAASLSAASPVLSDIPTSPRGPTGTLAASSLSAAIPVPPDIPSPARGPTGTLASPLSAVPSDPSASPAAPASPSAIPTAVATPVTAPVPPDILSPANPAAAARAIPRAVRLGGLVILVLIVIGVVVALRPRPSAPAPAAPPAGDSPPPSPIDALLAEVPAAYAEHARILLAGDDPRARERAGEAIATAPEADKPAIPEYIRNLAWLEHVSDCAAKKSILKKIAGENDPRALPALKLIAAAPPRECKVGNMNRECIECLRDDLAALIDRFERAATR